MVEENLTPDERAAVVKLLRDTVVHQFETR